MKQHIKRGAHTITALLLAAGLVACGERITETNSKAPELSPPSSSAVVIGQSPATPTAAEPAGTSPVAGNTSDVTQAEENRAKPQEGDSNSFSTLDPNSPQKAKGADPSPPQGGTRP